MAVFKIIYEDDFKEVIEGINILKAYFEFEIGVCESIDNKIHFMKIYIPDEKLTTKTKNIFYLHIADIIYKIYIDKFLKERLVEFLEDSYFFLNSKDIEEIEGKIRDILTNNEKIIDSSNIYYMNKKNEIMDEILECIRETDEINIEGFLTFRTKSLEKKLKVIIEKVVEEYIVEKEYNEFIKLLKYFVNIQESRIDEVNIIIYKDGNYIIKDKNGIDITKELFKEFVSNNMSLEINLDDILISGLITYCPEKIVIHCVENCLNKELINTINNVFLKKVVYCNNCETCRKINKQYRE
ncbi:putative sporulation protein YtxC [Clostridium cochlearium]|uniref:Putative sporulation protein YtxC n=1 Tax=Clostridium cochlearium TaxID=1494 RepID=A0A240AUX1_CLOCO|nr:putative sporulation protein YtxC [Clostridium cochlearium]MBV1820139.1 putative sporulation protein YtxC [Bacteroidales bacterium MSK.15.36]NSJ91995.1 putative sporulation protein YtxC [Coprococcus sp. MSK.21.13]MBE6064781.1 putative sporulation protein YtxC [Clostridium cochlearium]MCG4571831.1 putative sporulation protein YtxC [Clostridium cochlearium]MCR1970880.1 putative sporulation protein YtxC [Clostridium cochlearium]